MSEHSGRKRMPTEKGREYQLGLLYQQREQTEARIRETMDEMEAILNSTFSSQLLSNKEAQIDDDLGKYLEVHSKRQALLLEDSERSKEERIAETLDKEVFQLKKKILTAMSECRSRSGSSKGRGSSKGSGSSKSGSSKGSGGSRSSAKSIKLKALKEETKLEELRIEAEFLQKQKEADLAAQHEQKQLEIEKSAGKLKIYKEHEDNVIKDLPDPPGLSLIHI